MAAELVPIKFHKILQTRSYTVVILGTEEKKFAIYTDPTIGRVIQMHLTETEKPRPFTHDLLQMIFNGLDVRVLQVVINDVQDTIYYARLFLEQVQGEIHQILELDARPSDCLTLALMNHIPLFCAREVLEKAVAIDD